jgi:hypothetical protein
MSASELFFFKDSSSLDVSDIDDLFHDDDIEHTILVVAVKDL